MLTGLPNRLLLGDRAGHALQVAQRSGTSVAMLLLDLDRFKEVNDTLGHVAGDQLLVQVGHRLAEQPGVDTVARLGGDEFAILLEDATRESAVAMAERLTVALQETFRIEGVNLDLEASIGIALSSPGTTSSVCSSARTSRCTRPRRRTSRWPCTTRSAT